MKQHLTRALIGLIGATALALTGCAGKDGTSCTVAQTATGARISCDDGTHVDVANGNDGASCTVTDNGDGTKTITCDDGTSVTVANGSNGTSCTVTDANGVKTIKCADGTSVTVRDGATGESGGGVQVAQHHGEAFLKSEGEFDPALPNPKVFVKPTITSIVADEAGALTVNFKVDTLADQPYKILSAANLGIAKLVPAAEGEAVPHWVSYLYRTETVPTTGTYPNPAGTTAIQATRESSGTGATNGTLINNGDGTYQYKAKVNLATAKRGNDLVGYDRALTHRVTLSFGGHSGPTANTDQDFVPNGAAVSLQHKVVPTSVCINCHGFEFHGHGGDRMTMENCVTCHNPGNFDANGGETFDMAPMLHAIHAGGERASIPGADGIVWDDPITTVDESADNGEYAIWGNGNAKHTWWKVEFPAVAANCTACHQGTLPQVDNWKTKPTRAACTGCHDTTDFSGTGAHPAQTNDSGCSTCHPATGAVTSFSKPVPASHDWVAQDPRKQPEFDITLTMDAPANGTHYVAGEAPKIYVVLKDVLTGNTLDHTTIIEDDAAEGCLITGCPTRDGKFRNANLFVTGPRALKVPVLTTAARGQIFAGSAGPWDLTGKVDLKLKVDMGEDLVTFDHTGGDYPNPATITVPLSGGTFANIAAVTLDELVTWLNGNAGFKARAIAFVQGGKLGLRTRSLGRVTALQLLASDVTTTVFGGDTAIKMATGSTPSNQVRQRTNAANNDPKANWETGRIVYQLDPVDDLEPGTYTVWVEFADLGRLGAEPPFTDYKTPSVAKLNFQVKTATVEKFVADSCDSCHQGPDGKGYVLDYPRHNKWFDNGAADGCAACHDYQPQNANPAATFPGAKTLARRVHAVHNGANLNYPLATVDHEETEKLGRNWDIGYPMDVRNCESCHSAATSGTWKTHANRQACGGCHDADAAVVHMRLNTFDPTPDAQWSGDEQESCEACHR